MIITKTYISYKFIFSRANGLLSSNPLLHAQKSKLDGPVHPWGPMWPRHQTVRKRCYFAKSKYYLTLRRAEIQIESISYPDTKQITSAKILATVGDTTKKWYPYQEFLEYDGAEEELERWFR
jgi:hypothetical protein